MYKISYEKCVCLIFLVILAVLSCSGFRIDNLAMTDISKKNFHTSSSLSDEYIDRMFNFNSTQSVEQEPPTYRHKIRHHRLLRAHRHLEHHKLPSGERATRRGDLPSTTLPSEQMPQIPSSAILLPIKPIITRSQRSSDQRHAQKKHLPQHCQEQDITRKAYRADIVVHAKVQSMSSNKERIFFKVIEQLKNSSLPVDNEIQLTFSRDNSFSNCEPDDLSSRPTRLVKPPRQSKEYILFLQWHGAHNYTACAPPELLRRGKKRKNMFSCIRRVTDRNFVPRPVAVVSLSGKLKRKRPNRLKLVCRVKGMPVPVIHWYKDNERLKPSRDIRITYRRKNSTLIVKNNIPGTYKCEARGINNKDSRTYTEPHRSTTPTSEIGKECPEKYKTGYCLNGGICSLIEEMGEYFCQCPPEHTGRRCEQKTSSVVSTYQQTPVFSCKLGLSTNYYCNETTV